MKIMSFVAALVTATSIGIATECAWSDETTPGGSAVPAVRTPAPAINPAAGYYPPPPRRGGYAQRWQQPSQWPAPPTGYGQVRPYYPSQRQYRAAPAAPELTAKSTELDTAHATIEQLQLKLQHSREAERTLNEKVAAITGEQQALQAQVTELLAAPQAVQQAQSETTTSGQQPGAAGTEVAMLNGVLTELKIQLQNQNIRLQDAEQTLAAVVAERGGLQADLAACRLELTRPKNH